MKVAVLMADQCDEAALAAPRDALKAAGASLVIVSQPRDGVPYVGPHPIVGRTYDEADPREFDGVLLPGGEGGAGRLPALPGAQRFVRSMDGDGKPIAAIGPALWLLISAGLVYGRTLAGSPAMRGDISHAGGRWVDAPLVVDGNWLSGRHPGDVEAFAAAVVELFERHPRRATQARRADAPI